MLQTDRKRPGWLSLILVFLLAIFSFAAIVSPLPAQSAGQFTIKSIKVVMEGALLFVEVRMDHPVMPKVSAMYEDPENPRLLMDFKDAQLSDAVPSLQKSPSRLARQVRVGQHKNKVRIVIDLIPGVFYQADQVLYKKLNRFVIGLKAKAKAETKDPSAPKNTD